MSYIVFYKMQGEEYSIRFTDYIKAKYFAKKHYGRLKESFL